MENPHIVSSEMLMRWKLSEALRWCSSLTEAIDLLHSAETPEPDDRALYALPTRRPWNLNDLRPDQLYLDHLDAAERAFYESTGS